MHAEDDTSESGVSVYLMRPPWHETPLLYHTFATVADLKFVHPCGIMPSARSDREVSEGDRLQVVRVDGLTLVVAQPSGDAEAG